MRGGDLQLATGEHRKQVGEPGSREEEPEVRRYHEPLVYWVAGRCPGYCSIVHPFRLILVLRCWEAKLSGIMAVLSQPGIECRQLPVRPSAQRKASLHASRAWLQ